MLFLILKGKETLCFILSSFLKPFFFNKQELSQKAHDQCKFIPSVFTFTIVERKQKLNYEPLSYRTIKQHCDECIAAGTWDALERSHAF